MKRIFAAIAVAALTAITSTSCLSPPPAQPLAQQDPISDFIREARRGTPENALLGIGTSNHSNRGMARTVAETRARAELVRQLNVLVRNMVTDYMAGSEAEPQALLSFQESVTQTLAASQLRGAVVRDEINVGGEQVIVVMLARDHVAGEIAAASQAAAALAPHMGAAAWALERMDSALSAQNRIEEANPTLRNHD